MRRSTSRSSFTPASPFPVFSLARGGVTLPGISKMLRHEDYMTTARQVNKSGLANTTMEVINTTTKIKRLLNDR